MAKIHTVEALDQEIADETAWRVQELTMAFTLAQQSVGAAQKASLRSGVLLLYAHWEGWVKAVAKLYIRYVNTKSLTYESLSEAFLGNALKTEIVKIDEATTPLVHNKFATFIRTGMSKRATLSEDLIRTESNLSSSVLFDILERLGLERRMEYAAHARQIDAGLVFRRNTIAHGKQLDLTLGDFKELRADIMKLLRLFTDDILNAASTGRHLATPVPQS
jgi:hypothetical protein